MQLQSEWLETNGTGGFACGCIDGQLRRHWHGLLWVAQKPPRDRVLLVAGIEEYLRHPRMTVSLSCIWEGRRWLMPAGWPDYTPWPSPEWRWELQGGAVLRKRLFMPHGSKGEVHLIYTLDPSPQQDSLRLSVRPIMAFDGEEQQVDDRTLILGRRERCVVRLVSSKELQYIRRGEAMGPVEMVTERECEDEITRELYTGPELCFEVTSAEPVILSFRTDEESPPPSDLMSLWEKESARREKLPKPSIHQNHGDDLSKHLALAADQFIVQDFETGLPTVLAGYPWFTDWGRDTMISLPGLCLGTGHVDEARRIIGHFLHHMKDGLIPNIFPEGGHDPEYNTVDATLWMVDAFFRCYEDSNIEEHRAEFEKIVSIIEAYRHGTIHDIRMDDDALISAGSPGTQLTWMDVKIDEEVPTPRHGKPVEIQGLWYNALRLVAEQLGRWGEKERSNDYLQLAERCAESFHARYCIDAQQHLSDVVDRDGPASTDNSIRPNMVLPFALHYNVISEEKRFDVLKSVSKHLLTNRGLRSLAMDDPQFKGIYAGNRLLRDRAYHQGTVWMWLLWPYACGVAQYREQLPDLYEELQKVAKELVFHFYNEACLHQCSEIADGDFPFSPRGCFAQAWSVAALAEVLRRV